MDFEHFDECCCRIVFLLSFYSISMPLSSVLCWTASSLHVNSILFPYVVWYELIMLSILHSSVLVLSLWNSNADSVFLRFVLCSPFVGLSCRVFWFPLVSVLWVAIPKFLNINELYKTHKYHDILKYVCISFLHTCCMTWFLNFSHFARFLPQSHIMAINILQNNPFF